MDALRVGRSIRALRIRRGWRQIDLAEAAGISRSVVSRIERGAVGPTTWRSLERVCAALGSDLDVRVRWPGEGLDRLLDQAHAGIVDRFARLLRAAGWEAAVEVTFNVFGDRGSVDALGWHAGSGSLLIAEIKSVVADAQGTLMPLDRKTRLGPTIGRDRGWDVASVSKVLVVRDGSTNRDRVQALGATFDAALPIRGVAFRRWLGAPSGSVAALLFLRDAPTKSVPRHSAGRQRVNLVGSRPKMSQ